MPPLVSIGMSVFNAGAGLPRALRSLLLQSHSDWELILIDDGSSDGAVAMVRELGDPRVRVIAEAENKGLAVRLNRCIELARGKYFARMDADDVAYPQRLARQVAYLEAHAEVDLLGSDALVFTGSGMAAGKLAAGHSHDEICLTPWAHFPLPHPTWMGRLEWFRRNSYRASLRKSQDQELLLRSYGSSRFAALDEILLGYHYDALTLEKSLVGRYHFLRAQFHLIESLPTLARAALATTVHFGRLFRDAAIVLSGLRQWIGTRRWGVLSAAQRREWADVWQTVQNDNGERQ